MIPHNLPGFDIERDQVHIRRRNKELVAIDRKITFDADPGLLRKLPRVLPEQISGGSVQGLDAVSVAMDEQNAIVNQRRCFVGAIRQRPAPGYAKASYVVSVDLFQRTEALVIVSAPPGEPLSGGRILQQRPVWPVRVLVIDILAQDQPQVPFADDQHLVQALAAGAGDPAFGNRVVGWGARVSRLDGVRLGNAVSPV